MLRHPRVLARLTRAAGFGDDVHRRHPDGVPGRVAWVVLQAGQRRASKHVQIGEAVRATVPQPMWADIVAKLDELEPRSRDIADGDDLDEACEPDDFDEV